MNLKQKLEKVNYRDTYCDLPFRYHGKLLQMILETSFIMTLEREKSLDGYVDIGENINISCAKLKKAFKL